MNENIEKKRPVTSFAILIIIIRLKLGSKTVLRAPYIMLFVVESVSNEPVNYVMVGFVALLLCYMVQSLLISPSKEPDEEQFKTYKELGTKETVFLKLLEEEGILKPVLLTLLQFISTFIFEIIFIF